MSPALKERLNLILPRITSETFLNNKGLGNEIGFWIFEYPPEEELEVRAFITDVILPALAKQNPSIRTQVVNLFLLIIDFLQELRLLDRVMKVQADKGNDHLAAELRPVLEEEVLAQYILQQSKVDELSLLMLTGVGAAYPMLRTNTLLTAMHSLMGDTPLLMFYPGRYDGYSLSLFNKLADDNYYRAFRLVE